MEYRGTVKTISSVKQYISATERTMKQKYILSQTFLHQQKFELISPSPFIPSSYGWIVGQIVLLNFNVTTSLGEGKPLIQACLKLTLHRILLMCVGIYIYIYRMSQKCIRIKNNLKVNVYSFFGTPCICIYIYIYIYICIYIYISYKSYLRQFFSLP